jgi:ABC-type uncharacterized transport system substrate-binding protein
VARAQQGERVRRIGVLSSGDEIDPVVKTIFSAFTQALADLGWADGRNVRMDRRWGGTDINRFRALARELVSPKPDIILANGTLATVALQRETLTIPIVFTTAAAARAVTRTPRRSASDVRRPLPANVGVLFGHPRRVRSVTKT